MRRRRTRSVSVLTCALKLSTETDTLKRAENDSPGATASGAWRSASAGAVIGSKQMTSAIAGAKICA